MRRHAAVVALALAAAPAAAVSAPTLAERMTAIPVPELPPREENSGGWAYWIDASPASGYCWCAIGRRAEADTQLQVIFFSEPGKPPVGAIRVVPLENGVPGDPPTDLWLRIDGERYNGRGEVPLTPAIDEAMSAPGVIDYSFTAGWKDQRRDGKVFVDGYRAAADGCLARLHWLRRQVD